jgi:hypothetical protein
MVMLLITFEHRRGADKMFRGPQFITPILNPDSRRSRRRRRRSTEVMKYLTEQLHQRNIMLCAVKKNEEIQEKRETDNRR